MRKLNLVALLAIIPTTAFALLTFFVREAEAANMVKVTCDRQTSIPTVIATFSKQARSQIVPIMSFLPQYFSTEDASLNCEQTAAKLDGFYSQNQMNYLASDTVNELPVVCAVPRRGLKCNGYNSEILFSLATPVNPTNLLYDMLGKDFKGPQLPSSRTVSRIYTDLRQPWWPF